MERDMLRLVQTRVYVKSRMRLGQSGLVGVSEAFAGTKSHNPEYQEEERERKTLAMSSGICGADLGVA